ncbi:FK506-binding protein-like [Carettochelys insculpta]|uniref:FK506-binding protein-like n=1 Tax=Carettochelys insculpta TaxID=44489 RepID=UPI003EB8A117
MAAASGTAEAGGAANGVTTADEATNGTAEARGAANETPEANTAPWGLGLEEEQQPGSPGVPDERDPGGPLWVSPDGAFTKRVLRAGVGLDKPVPGSLCRVYLAAPAEAPLGYPANRWATLELGEGDGALDGLVDACLESMAPGERAELRAGDGVMLGVHLASFVPVPEPWQLGVAEKWALALQHKERGSERYRAGEVGVAARCYSRALRLVIAASPAPLDPEHARLRADLHANLAACQLRLGQPAHAARNCTKALALQPGHTKARYRRGLARAATGDLEGAAEDLRQLLTAEPGNTAARRELQRVGQRARERDVRLARAMSKLFS